MRKVLCFLMIVIWIAGWTVMDIPAAETEEELNLNARAAVLMDAESGRVLYGKDADIPYPMASTTKVMTLIVALENGSPDTVVTASPYAASMPEVHLGVRSGEQYRMGDLYYALMLESFNDAAVMIAEGIAGSVENFADMMNEKAGAIGCTDTHFITPNGLDASDAGGVHSSTARDMALMMRYAIGNEEFLRITQTKSYNFTDVEGRRCFSVNNKNTLFYRMDGAVSGKTGYTSGAGYCYVCAVQIGDKCFTAALLGSGWPPHKNYKWQDVEKLMAYGDKNYEYKTVQAENYISYEAVQIRGGTSACAVVRPSEGRCRILMKNAEQLRISTVLPGQIDAPVREGDSVGSYTLYLDDFPVIQNNYIMTETVEKESIYLKWRRRMTKKNGVLDLIH